MGGLKKLGRGLGAGLQVFGQGMIDKEKREEEKRRYDEQSAREERRLEIAEQDAASREQMAKMNLAMKKVEYNNKMLVETIMKNDFDPEVTGQAFSQFGPAGGRNYSYNPIRSKEIGGISYDIRVPETDPESGQPRIGEDGKILYKSLAPGSNRLEFSGTDANGNDARGQMASYFSPLMNADFMLAHELQGITAEQTFQQSEELFRKKAKADREFLKTHADTPQGRKMLAELERGEEQNKKTKAETSKLNAEAGAAGLAKAPDSTVTSITGKKKPQTSQDVEKAKAFAHALNSSGEYGKVSPDDAARIMEFEGDNDAQEKVKQAIQAVEQGAWTQDEMLKALKTTNLPKAFLQKITAGYMSTPAPEKRGYFSNLWKAIRGKQSK